MRKVMAALILGVLTIVVSAPAFAQQAQPPKGTEGPDVQKRDDQTRPEGPDIRKSKRSPKASNNRKKSEGPDTRQKKEPKATMDAGGRKSQEGKTP
jgi:hypothetical protein